MMDCKEALTDTAGDFEQAVDFLRKKGLSKAAKKADRTTNEGLVHAIVAADHKSGAMLEFNCETDFVARNEDFLALAKKLAAHALATSPVGVTLEGFLAESMDGTTIEEVVKLASGKTGEAVSVKRVAKFGGAVGEYRHFNGQVGVLVEVAGVTGDAALALAREVALHIASADPIAVSTTDIPVELLDRERRIAEEQVAAEGKPEAIRGKIVDGKVKKFAADRALLEQAFIKDESVTVGAMVARLAGASVVRFARFKVGEAV